MASQGRERGPPFVGFDRERARETVSEKKGIWRERERKVQFVEEPKY